MTWSLARRTTAFEWVAGGGWQRGERLFMRRTAHRRAGLLGYSFRATGDATEGRRPMVLMADSGRRGRLDRWPCRW